MTNWYYRARRPIGLRMASKRKGKTGASVFYTDGEQVLLLRRSKGGNIGAWCLPGGKSDGGESRSETAKRESIEEIGRFEGKRFGKVKDENWRTYLHFVSSPFECSLNDEHDDWEWVKFEDVKKYPLAPYLADEIDEMIRQTKGQRELVSKD